MQKYRCCLAWVAPLAPLHAALLLLAATTETGSYSGSEELDAGLNSHGLNGGATGELSLEGIGVEGVIDGVVEGEVEEEEEDELAVHTKLDTGSVVGLSCAQNGIDVVGDSLL